MRQYGTYLAVFFVLWLGLLALGPKDLLRDPGTFWHTACGQRVLSGGGLITTDSFSFTAAGQPWIDSQWLAACGMALLYRAAGWDGLLLATATILAATYAWLAWRLVARGLHPLGAAFLLALVLAASSHQFHARPLILTLMLFAWTYGRVVDLDAGRLKLGSLAWLVPVFILWANLHGGVLAGLGTLLLTAAGWCVLRVMGGNSPVHTRGDFARLLVILAAACAAVFVNPYGIALPDVWLAILGLPLPEIIEEHAPLNFGTYYAWAVVAIGIVYGWVLLGIRPRQARVSWLLPLVWFVLACQRVRHAPLFTLSAAIAIAEMLPHTRWSTWLQSRDYLQLPLPAAARSDSNWTRFLLALPLAAVMAVAVIQWDGIRAPVVGRGWATLDATRWPMDLLSQLRKIERSSQGNRRVFNEMLLGGWIIFHTPALEVFVDDRCELYGREFLLEYQQVASERPEQIDALQRRYAFEWALVVGRSPLDRFLSRHPEWQVVKRTAAAALYRHTKAGSPKTTPGK